MQIDFKIPNSFSLKDKRRVVKGILDKTKRMFNVSIAEVDSNEIINFAALGLACVSNSKIFIESSFDKILGFYDNAFEIEIVDVRRDFL